MREHSAEVLVVGAGPAGLAAAAAAAEHGAEVLLVDENPRPGGQIWRPERSASLRPDTSALLERAKGVRRLAGTVVFDVAGRATRAARHRLRALDEDGETVELAADRVVLTLGATERFLPFPGWTLPGILGVGGLQAMVKGGMPVRGRRVLLAGSGPLLLAVATALLDAGAEVMAIAEQAPRAAVLRFGAGLALHPRKLTQAAGLLARLRGVRRLHSAWPLRAEGDEAVERIVLRQDDRERVFDVDVVGCGFGLVPATGLAALLGCEVCNGSVDVDELQRTSVDGVLCAGESTGIGGVDLALAEGELAGLTAAGSLEAARAASARVRRERRFALALERAFSLRPELRDLPSDDTVVCRCEDVAWGAIRGWRDARQAKLETRCGMGPCQGRVCGAALEFLCGWERERPRPPLVPVPFKALAATPSGRETSGDTA